jgi:hypothetical protein
MRCIREATRAECDRCLTASAECVFSVARKTGRPPAAGGGSNGINPSNRAKTRVEKSWSREGSKRDRHDDKERGRGRGGKLGEREEESERERRGEKRGGRKRKDREGRRGERGEARGAEEISGPGDGDTERECERSYREPVCHRRYYSSDFTGDLSLETDSGGDWSFFDMPGSSSFLDDETPSSLGLYSGTVGAGGDAQSMAFWNEGERRWHPNADPDKHLDVSPDRGLSPIHEAPTANLGAPISTPLSSNFMVADQHRVYGPDMEWHEPALQARSGIVENIQTSAYASESESASDRANITVTVNENAVQQLLELNGRLFAHISYPSYPRSHLRIPKDPLTMELDMDGVEEDENRDAYTNSDSDTNAQIVRLQQLTAHVIESSSTFHGILSSTQTPIHLDTPATLLILTAYIRMAQLHHILYKHIQSILLPTKSLLLPLSLPSTTYSSPLSSTTSPSAETSPRSVAVAFPTLHIGGVSLSRYPRFQLKFILQICVHHLGEVEALLGLPAGFCVSGKTLDSRTSRGILHQDSGRMVLLVRTVLREADETLKGIRSVLAELVEEFRGSIQV